jgi:hypothetical protein
LRPLLLLLGLALWLALCLPMLVPLLSLVLAAAQHSDLPLLLWVVGTQSPSVTTLLCWRGGQGWAWRWALKFANRWSADWMRLCQAGMVF